MNRRRPIILAVRFNLLFLVPSALADFGISLQASPPSCVAPENNVQLSTGTKNSSVAMRGTVLIALVLGLGCPTRAVLLAAPRPPPLAAMRGYARAHRGTPQMSLVLTEENAQAVLDECQSELGTLFGSNPQSLKVGITGVRRTPQTAATGVPSPAVIASARKRSLLSWTAPPLSFVSLGASGTNAAR